MAKSKKGIDSTNGEAKKVLGGKELAASAIEEMHDVRDDAKEFVEECRRRGRDPQEVAAFIAGREGLPLGAEEPQEDDRKRLYHLLKEVIRESVKTSVSDYGSVYSLPSISQTHLIQSETRRDELPYYDTSRPKITAACGEGGSKNSANSVAANVASCTI